MRKQLALNQHEKTNSDTEYVKCLVCKKLFTGHEALNHTLYTGHNNWCLLLPPPKVIPKKYRNNERLVHRCW